MRSNQQTPGKVRIIGGRWRGSLLPVVDAAGLRPSADRSRERLFNWLQADISGARCLDLFAGSGALGLEALSRGAGACVLVEKSPAVSTSLRESIQRLQASDAILVRADALNWLEQQPTRAWDIVFLDPPFASGLLAPACELLQQNGHVRSGTLVYVEQARADNDCWPAQWQALREAQSREARCVLLRVGPQ